MERAIVRQNKAAVDDLFGARTTADLKQRSIRGGGVTLVGQGLTFALQTGAMIALARLLSAEDFGVQGMVIAMTGFLTLFRDAGLSVASVQRDILTHEHTSTLFWINVLVGALLTLAAVTMAPLLAAFYGEPRLVSVTLVSSAAFFFNGLAVQHRALLNRTMRFIAMVTIDIVALGISSIIGISMAVAGYGYWALVGIAVSSPMITAVGVWIAVPWRPGQPRRSSGVRAMMHFGGIVTLNSLVVYLAYNVEKVLLGRFWGAEVLGLYGRAFQLVDLPVRQLNSAINTVALPALSRAQSDLERVRRVFLRIYSIVISLTIPVTIIFTIFAEEIVHILLGPKWVGAVILLRLLAPIAVVAALINPVGWFLQATGRIVRSLNIALLIVPVVLLGIALGLRHGPSGVALGYSTAMISLLVPIMTWSKHGTGITILDFWNSIKPTLISGVIAGVGGLLVKIALGGALAPIPLLVLGLASSLGLYAWTLLVVMRQGSFYRELLTHVFHGRPTMTRD